MRKSALSNPPLESEDLLEFINAVKMLCDNFETLQESICVSIID